MATRPRTDKTKVETFPTAHSLKDAANSANTLQGYAAMNDPTAHSEIAHIAAEEEPMESPAYDEYREICLRAYELYEARNGDSGSAEDDWFRAEQEVRARRGSKE